MARRKNQKKGQKKTFGTRDDSNNQKNWTELVKENAKWESYYKDLGVIPEEEWDTFKKTCQTQLPLTFRITGSRKHAKEVLQLFQENHLPNLTNVVWEGETVKPPMALPWYPQNLGWQLDVSKSVIRKNEQFSRMQRFLVVENAVGNISRQEAVSMIPPIVLDVKPEHYVLDMCAAPGSKTAQLIEALHAESDEPSGFVIANDADYKRSHMLVHQLKRLNSANLMVVNHDAQFFPRIKTANASGPVGPQFLKFDRILCDVPCSGDGTMRKNVNVWKDWNTGSGLGLHIVQFNILDRGLNLLKEGGKLVYSTCSMNPIENEAVVAAALRKWGDKIRLVNCDDQLPGLVRSKGITQWKVYDKQFEIREKGHENCLDSWFPPSAEEVEKFNLDRCMRVYPHQQNTGGFFITVFEKIDTTSTPPPAATATATATANEEEQAQEPELKKAKVDISSTASHIQKKEKLPRDANEEPFVFVDPNHPQLAKCWSFYGIDDKFDKSSCLVRNATGEPTRTIYHVATPLKQLIVNNEDRLKIVYSGVKLFVSQRSDIDCSWRIQSESLPIMKQHMHSDRIVPGNMEMLKKLLTEAFPRYDDLIAENVDPEFVSKTQKLSAGCTFIKVDRNDPSKEDLFLPIWNGSKCINLMVCKEDAHELLYRIFGIETTSKQNPKAEHMAKKAQEESANTEGESEKEPTVGTEAETEAEADVKTE